MIESLRTNLIEVSTQTREISDRNVIRDYFLTICVLVKVTSPFFGAARGFELFIFSILAFSYFSKFGFTIEKKMNIVLTVVSVLILLQGLLFGFKILTLFTYVATMVLTPYFLYSVIGTRFLKYLINVIYFTAIYTTIFWLLQNLIPGIDLLFRKAAVSLYKVVRLDSWARSLLVYTVAFAKVELLGISIYRNNGIFHEAGSYAHWICFCIGLNSVYQKKFYNKINVILTFALLTTFSTAGYLMLFVILVYWIGLYGRNYILNVLLAVVFIYLSFYTYQKTSFLGQKVEEQITFQRETEIEGQKSRGRFVAARKALFVISRYPITGRGIISSSADLNQYSSEYIGTATLGIVARYGVLFGLLYWLYLYRGIKRLFNYHGSKKTYSTIFFIVLLMGGLSQKFFFDNITAQLFLCGLIQNRPITD